jgi:hypothetical protein
MTAQWLELLAQLYENEVFVSYDRDDRPFVKWLEGRLIRRGYHVFWDDRIQGGRDFKEALGKAIEKSIAGVVIETPASRDSKWVGAEIHLLLQRGPLEVFPLVPLLLKGTDIRRELSERHLNYVDFRDADWQSRPMSPATREALGELFRALSFPKRRQSIGIRTAGLLTVVAMIAITILVAAASRLSYDAQAAIVERSAHLAQVDQALENRYTLDPGTRQPVSGLVVIGTGLQMIRQPSVRSGEFALDTWSDGLLRQREFFEGERSLLSNQRLIGTDAYVYEGNVLVGRVRRFTLGDDRTIEERWTPDGLLVGRYQVLDEPGARERPLITGTDAARRVPVTGAAWSIPLYR